MMKILWIGMLLWIGAGSLPGQVVQLQLDMDKGCSYYGEEQADEAIFGFSASQEAGQEVKRILDQVGLPANFVIKAANVPNAVAQVQGGKRYILYSQQFMNDIQQKSGDYWSKVAILAHEIGHHLSGHTLGADGSRPLLELEADEFCGFVLRKLGASLTQAQSAVRVGASEQGSRTHPPKNARMEAIAVGYQKAKEVDQGLPDQADTTDKQEGPGPEAPVREEDKAVQVLVGDRPYPVRQFGGLLWMTRNMNLPLAESYCYEDRPSNCHEYGRIYTWFGAMEACTAAGPGWRLPTSEEWGDLARLFGALDPAALEKGRLAYAALMEGGDSGFHAQLGGIRNVQGQYSMMGDMSTYWAQTEEGPRNAVQFHFVIGEVGGWGHSPKHLSTSYCRCVKEARP